MGPQDSVATAAGLAPDAASLPTRRQVWWVFLMRDKKALVGLIAITLLTLSAVFAPWIVPYDPNAQDFKMIGAPTWEHWLGTDDLGRDLLRGRFERG